MTIQEATLKLRGDLETIYESREASNIASMVLEHITSLSRGQRLTQKDMSLTGAQLEKLNGYSIDLLSNMPVQYVLGEAWFYGYRFSVNDSVLIPRPETEELVEWVLDDQAGDANVSILDIGTGSGCIAIALQLKLKNSQVSACDISLPALELAAKNAKELAADVDFFHTDVLVTISAVAADFDRISNTARQALDLPMQNIIVSNPPYIPAGEEKNMSPNVVLFEPSNALFVPNQDPLVFYRAIAKLAVSKLYPGGSVYVEIHEGLGEEVLNCFREHGLGDLVLRKDMQGKDRMVRARRSY